jgi:hypothetical protein
MLGGGERRLVEVARWCRDKELKDIGGHDPSTEPVLPVTQDRREVLPPAPPSDSECISSAIDRDQAESRRREEQLGADRRAAEEAIPSVWSRSSRDSSAGTSRRLGSRLTRLGTADTTIESHASDLHMVVMWLR